MFILLTIGAFASQATVAPSRVETGQVSLNLAASVTQSGDSTSYMTKAERDWCSNLSRIKICNHVYGFGGSGQWAISKAEKCSAEATVCRTGNEANALQHCMWSGILTLDHGERTARGFLTRHEEGDPDVEDTEYDWKNNEIGIRVAHEMTSDDDAQYGSRGYMFGRCNHLAFLDQLEVRPG